MTIDIATLIEAAGGEIVGKTRLQKLVYLLDQVGIPTGFSFSYHHYGPYSEELSDAVDDAIVFRDIKAEQRRRSDGVPYTVYRSLRAHPDERTKQILASDAATAAIRGSSHRSATVLELAATIHWLTSVEGVPDWISELRRRKGVKTEAGRAEKALALLKELNLEPAAL
jgi:uncharacterized protein